MSDETTFESMSPELASDEPALIVDVEGFEGPLDLTAARAQFARMMDGAMRAGTVAS